jgi:hypothetical protein
MNVEILHIDDCPSWGDGLKNMLEALLGESLSVEIDLVLVKDEQQAERLKFLGSPSFRIDGQDLWPEERENYALSCRIYSTPRGLLGAPSVEMLRERIQAYLEDGREQSI